MGEGMNYPRRQQLRRLSHAAEAATASAAAALLGFVTAGAGAQTAAAVLLLSAAGLALYARHWLSLAGRSGVGARSEDEVRRRARAASGGRVAAAALAALAGARGHRLVGDRAERRGVRDRDQDEGVRRSPSRSGADQAAWLSRRRRRWCRRGAVAVVCLVRARGVQRLERDVLVVSIDRLIPALRRAISPVSRRAA